MTRMQLWEQYAAEAEELGRTAYSFSRFCALLEKNAASGSDTVCMHFNWEPGGIGFSDFSGKTFPTFDQNLLDPA